MVQADRQVGQHSELRIKHTTLRTQTVVLRRKIIPHSIEYWFTINRICRFLLRPMSALWMKLLSELFYETHLVNLLNKFIL